MGFLIFGKVDSYERFLAAEEGVRKGKRGFRFTCTTWPRQQEYPLRTVFWRKTGFRGT